MVDAKQWAICRPPSARRDSELRVQKQDYINPGNGIGIHDIADFVERFPKLGQQYIKTMVYNHWQQDAYARAVHKQPSDAYVLYVPAGTQQNAGITLPARSSKHCLAYRIYILIGQNARVTIQHDQWGNAHNNITIHLEPGAQLTLLQTNKHAQEQYTHLACYQQQRSNFNFHGWYTHATYNYLNVFFQEDHAEADIKLGLDSHGDMHSWFKTTQVHQAPDTRSNLLLKGLLHDTSRSTHVGMIHIDEGAQRVQADLSSRYLLLSNQAQAYTVPSLEVLTDDVYCSHASAIGSFDQEQLFYMMSRGLSAELAKELLADAFFNDLWQMA